jgi:hypothetical protein
MFLILKRNVMRNGSADEKQYVARATVERYNAALFAYTRISEEI